MMNMKILGLVFLILSASFGVAYAINLSLIIPAQVVIFNPPPPVNTYWVANVTSFNFNTVTTDNSTESISIKIINSSTVPQTLSVTSPNLPPYVSLVVKNGGVTYSPILISANGEINLSLSLLIGESAIQDTYNFSIVFNSV